MTAAMLPRGVRPSDSDPCVGMEITHRTSVAGIYFVQAETGGLIKIGRTRHLGRRMQGLRSSCPIPLRALAVIVVDHPEVQVLYERELHDRFVSSRAHCEWFAPTDDLLEVVRGNRLISVYIRPDGRRKLGPPSAYAIPLVEQVW